MVHKVDNLGKRLIGHTNATDVNSVRAQESRVGVSATVSYREGLVISDVSSRLGVIVEVGCLAKVAVDAGYPKIRRAF